MLPNITNLCLGMLVFMTLLRLEEAAVITTPITTKCEFYNSTCAENPDSCPTVATCGPPAEYERTLCFVVWSINFNGSPNVTLKGCAVNHANCFNQPDCVEKTFDPKNNVLYCCCEGDMCNQNYTWDPQPAPPTIPPTTISTIQDERGYEIYLIIGVILFLIPVIGFGLFKLLHKGDNRYFNGWKVGGYNLFKVPTSDPNPMPPPSPEMERRPIELQEMKAQGRFGCVWRAQFKSEEVAVKIFPVQDRQSWVTEKQIYRLAHMYHPNILEFIGAETRGENLHAEFWLITAYHEKGSLCDFLKANTITWTELLRIAETMGRGLAHLHESILGKSPNEATKPTISHRDFKSKNVLLKSDLTACIADFGLAATFESGKSCGDTHGQVGTRRYMAPEVLEGAISFTSDSFLRIDMYACGLVLWELVSRCKAQDGPIPEYRLPFEEEVGSHPTLEDIQESVVHGKVRPVIQRHWRNHVGLTVMCDTMEECWDHDPEARLSASCVVERILGLRRSQQHKGGSNFGRIENDSSTEPLSEGSS